MNYKTIKQQDEAFAKFSKLKVGALFMEMGIGKTKIAIDLINHNINEIDIVIWLTPTSTIGNLKKEIDKWYTADVPIVPFGYGALSGSDRKYLQLLNLIENKRVFAIADESIFIKNAEAKRFKRAFEIGCKSEYRLILNGTPITKNEWDIYNQMYFLSPKIIGMNENEFLHTFFKKISYKKAGQKRNEFYKLSDVNIDYLHKLIEPYIVRAKFEFDKEINIQKRLIPSHEQTKERYTNGKTEILNSCIFGNEKDNLVRIFQFLNKVSSEDVDKQKAIVNYINNKQIIVFCNYIDELNAIAEQIDCYTITGATKKQTRYEIIDQFTNNNKPLLMTFGVGAFGLNLQMCNEIVFSSLTFDFGLIEQATGRIKRVGQEQDITYTYFETDLPINKFISENLEKKENLSTLLIDKLKE